ncbi:preprotein translocase subunit YajC [Floricoccus penangensis]|uniref:Preprotein translocase subunit YajC n=1 Tax=Floricoccus penangensis TaxID=1859475 RepID=A0A9Q5JHC4_9LACT|nr:preprotein translocase subunit YajC [Floricoccus penangensis]OFI47002.1 preprotein translocase subunit YajC [Floricoccus penangensis]URZ87651.1 preprotein translocase subunit YajC [Floricoccus penangensis]
MGMIIVLIAFAAMMYFTQRQQKKAQASRQDLLNNMEIGSEIITRGGLHGVLSAINDSEGTIELDCEGVFLTFERSAVLTVKPAASTVVSDEDDSFAEHVENKPKSSDSDKEESFTDQLADDSEHALKDLQDDTENIIKSESPFIDEK